MTGGAGISPRGEARDHKESLGVGPLLKSRILGWPKNIPQALGSRQLTKQDFKVAIDPTTVHLPFILFPNGSVYCYFPALFYPLRPYVEHDSMYTYHLDTLIRWDFWVLSLREKVKIWCTQGEWTKYLVNRRIDYGATSNNHKTAVLYFQEPGEWHFFASSLCDLLWPKECEWKRSVSHLGRRLKNLFVLLHDLSSPASGE